MEAKLAARFSSWNLQGSSWTAYVHLRFVPSRLLQGAFTDVCGLRVLCGLQRNVFLRSRLPRTAFLGFEVLT